MISAGKLQNRCPGCRAQILGFYDALLQPRTGALARPFARPRAPLPNAASTTSRLAQNSRRLNTFRSFSTTRQLLQDSPKNENTPAPEEDQSQDSGRRRAEDIETLVRQARQTFGDTLPADYLTPEEYKVYERLYGAPLRETGPEDVGIPYMGESGDILETRPSDLEKHTLYRENEDGTLEEVEYTLERSDLVENDDGSVDIVQDGEQLIDTLPLTDAQIDYLNVTANNQREYDALVKLQRDFEAAALQAREEESVEAQELLEQERLAEEEEEQEIEEEEEYDEEYERELGAETGGWEGDNSRLHPFTVLGQFKTRPSTIQLPKTTFVQPITELLKRTDTTHIKECAETKLGGPGLPYGPGSPRLQISHGQKGLKLQAGYHKMSEIEADTFLAAIMPGIYATTMSALVETRKRLGSNWLRELLTREGGKGPRVLDLGGGGAGLLAWERVLQAEWDVLREKGEVKGLHPPGKKTTVVGNENLRHRVSRFLHNTTFLPRLPDYLHSLSGREEELDTGGGPAPRKVFDVIIVSHMLMPLDQDWKRKDLIDNLWEMLSPDGGIMIVVEKAHPRGFEAVADVRSRFLREFAIPPTPTPHPEEITAPSERKREPGMIIAPCTNHAECPMYHHPGLSPGRKDFCHFSQRFIRPPFLQQIHGASHRSHEDIKFSYVSLRRGRHIGGPLPAADVSSDAGPVQYQPSGFLQGKEATDRAFAGYEKAVEGEEPQPLSWPRSILTPLKRHGHVTLDLCTPGGKIERWVVPKSFSKQAYHDARKHSWGDLWALGAKTRTMRNVRLGRAGEVPNLNDGGVRATAAAEGHKKKPKVVEINVHPQLGVLGAYEKPTKSRAQQRKSKAGKRVKLENLMESMGANEVEDPDDVEDRKFMKRKSKWDE
ncbi:methyltransferase-like protein 17, mitochondrial [Podospora fimiseda]|uniref:Methyltransferase-like protein 17, mitochondrial n=1 Tax=Podospora fimiseda TaxID=252190 RepID=A0AAN7BQ93_9PEZI|nr:methyltransferase-like protein 17, mitochondrial [Podospora fimiseda]